jgi:rhodanese-related sulfurtransferase
MKIKLFLIFTFLLASVACSGQANAPANDAGTTDAPAIDVSSLPETLDVNAVASLQNRDDVVLIDVREQWEYDEGHIPGITLIPMSELQSRLAEIPTDKEVILTCRSGNRSGQVYEFLQQQGYDNVHNMSGGILAWESAGLEVER